jgi:drug/metabolite transporter (DMT)-like permease
MEITSSQRPSRMKAVWVTDLAMVSVVLIWGLNFSIMKGLYQYFDPLAFTFLRFLVAVTALTLVMRALGVSLAVERKDLPALAAMGILSNTIYQLLFVNGLANTTAGNAGLLMASTPVFAYLTGVFLKRERFRKTILGGIVLSMMGVAAIMVFGSRRVTLGANWQGDALVLAAAILWGFYSGGSARLIMKYGALRVTLWLMLTGTVALLPVLFPWAVRQDWTAVPLRGWLAFSYSTFLSIVYSYVVWSHGIQRIGISRTVVYSNVTPIVALFGAWLLLGEKAAMGQYAGVALILTGVFIVRSQKQVGGGEHV